MLGKDAFAKSVGCTGSLWDLLESLKLLERCTGGAHGPGCLGSECHACGGTEHTLPVLDAALARKVREAERVGRIEANELASVKHANEGG